MQETLTFIFTNFVVQIIIKKKRILQHLQLEIQQKIYSKMKISVLILISLYLVSNASAAVYPSSSGSSCCDDNIVLVNGDGKVQVQPDIAKINVGVSVTAKTSQDATQGVADKISIILTILAKSGVQKKDIETQYISIYPQYDYPDGKTVLVGQTATQTLSVTVRNIDKNGGNLGSIIDSLVTVDGIQFNGLVFDKENKTDAQKQARKAAFNDAKNKAGEYADLADRKLGRVLVIIDSSSTNPSPLYLDAQAFSAKSSASTSVPVGTIDVSYTVQVKFALN